MLVHGIHLSANSLSYYRKERWNERKSKNMKKKKRFLHLIILHWMRSHGIHWIFQFSILIIIIIIWNWDPVFDAFPISNEWTKEQIFCYFEFIHLLPFSSLSGYSSSSNNNNNLSAVFYLLLFIRFRIEFDSEMIVYNFL